MLKITTTIERALGLVWLFALAQVLAAGELQPPNQPVAQPAGQPAAQPLETPTAGPEHRLPKINVYVKRSEIKKLLGIDTRINYVTNGNINAYPLGFTIPLGYNQSDIIFTWQNLGQTNVNYSISLVIGNIQAVEAPLINITRSGLIPRQEQVFKITLPCSGKVTDEVDVQVLINITGYLSPDEPDGVELLELAAEGSGETGPSTGAPEPMQRDQAGESARLVSRTLAIKRKKICSKHPVQVNLPRLPAPTVAPPVVPVPARTLPPSERTSSQPSQPATVGSQNQNRWAPDNEMMTSTSEPAAAAVDALELNTRKLERLNLINRHRHQPAPYLAGSGWPPSSPIPADNPLVDMIASQRQNQNQNPNQQQQAAAGPLLIGLVGFSLLVSLALLLLATLGSARRRPLDKLSAITSCLLRRAPNTRAAKAPKVAGVISSLRVGPKSNASSVSALSAISGHSHTLGHKAAYCFKANCAGYLANTMAPSFPVQQSHYQQPPTADLLGTGTGYQTQNCQQQYPIYHIATGNTSQTTRLIWNQGNGTSPEGFTVDAGSYMPLSNAARSDSGSVYQSVYQTIY